MIFWRPHICSSISILKKLTPTKTLPKTFSNNLSQLVAHEKNRDASIPTHLKMMNKAIQFFGSEWFLLGNLIIFALWAIINIVPF